MEVILRILGGLLCALFSASLFAEIKLSEDCPPGFENVSGKCELRTLYQMYGSLQSGGVGGLKTALPEVRDGFSPQQIDLGRFLFFDPVLSADGSVSCASCHQPDKGFSDGLALSVGIGGRQATRSAPSLWNVGFLRKLFWDGRASSLEEQMQGPLYSDKEMGSTPALLLQTLQSQPQYKSLFRQAFPATQIITLEQVYIALAAFEASLISLNSRYDQYAHGYAEALTLKEIEGMNVFRSFVARCAECHTPPLFSNQQFAVIGTPEQPGEPRDVGAAATFKDESMTGAFKVPSLRNIELTAPYMHSGRFGTLRDAAEFYTRGRGHALAQGEELKLHWHIWEPNLSEQELDRLVDFMKALTDERFKPAVPAELPSGLPLVHRNSLEFDEGSEYSPGA